MNPNSFNNGSIKARVDFLLYPINFGFSARLCVLVIDLNDSTLEVVRKKMDYSKFCFEKLSMGARNCKHQDFVEIYEVLASVFEGYLNTFERIIELEEPQLTSKKTAGSGVENGS